MPLVEGLDKALLDKMFGNMRQEYLSFDAHYKEINENFHPRS